MMDTSIVVVITIVISAIATAVGVYQAFFNIKEANKVVRQKIEQAESKLDKEPDKAKPAWDLARATLESYFNRNLSQISSIFWLSVIVMIVGFGILYGESRWH